MRLGDQLWPGLARSRPLVVLPLGSCEQHGRFVAWACSPDASAFTGSVLHADGGFTG
ncbi:MAG TPA: hypothetical protein VIJ82_20990 [Streptosporangiaceae bacterium]